MMIGRCMRPFGCAQGGSFTCAVVYATLTFSSRGMAQVDPNDVFRLIVAPASPQNPRHSEAAIIELDDGRLLLGWTEFYGSSAEDHAPARLVGKVSADGGALSRTWGPKYTLVENDGSCNVMEVNFLRLKSGAIALFHVQKNTESTDCRIMMRISTDEGATFSSARQLSPDNKYTGLTNGRCIRLSAAGTLNRGAQGLLRQRSAAGSPGLVRPRRLSTGRILLEAWEGGDSYCCISDDDGETWRDGERVRPTDGECWEPACVELKDRRVMMLMRTQVGGQYKSISTDGGETWSTPAPTSLVGTAAPVAISRVPTTGDLLAIWNHNPGADSRNPLTAALSRDEGETWEHFRNLEDAPGDAWAYPAVTWVGERALITYFNYAGGHSLFLRSVPAAWFYE